MSEKDFWLLMFCSIVAMQCHPGFSRPGAGSLSLDEICELCDEAKDTVNLRKNFFSSGG